MMAQKSKLIHPYFSQSPIIASQHLLNVWTVVGSLLLVDVTNFGAGHYLQLSSTHPDTKRQLNILSSPDIHACVIPTQFLEPCPVHSKQASSNGRGLDTPAWVAQLFGSIQSWQILPEEVKSPIEPSPQIGGHGFKVEVVKIDVVNDRRSNGFLIQSNSFQQRLEPILFNFTMTIKKHQSLTFSSLEKKL